MRYFLLTLFIVISVTLNGQEKEIENDEKTIADTKRMNNPIAGQIGFQGSVLLPLDDNFINQAYSQDVGFNVNVRLGIKEFIGIGINLNRYEMSNTNPRFLGSTFSSSRFYSNSIFAYYQHPIFKLITTEFKLGLFDSSIANRVASTSILNDQRQKLNFNGLLSGLNFIYYLTPNKRFGVSVSTDVYFTLSDKIKTAPSETDFINRNVLSSLSLGIVIGN